MQSLITKLRAGVAAIDTLNEIIGRGVAWLALAMVLVTFTVVVLRYAFDLGWIAMQESVTWLHSLVFLLGAAYTLKHAGHVRVDIFYAAASPRRKALVDLLGSLLLLLPICLFIFYVSWDYVADSWSVWESSREAGGLPGIFLLKSTLLVMAGLLLLQGLAEAIRAALVLTGATPPTPPETPDQEL